jgi:hypothetical protein
LGEAKHDVQHVSSKKSTTTAWVRGMASGGTKHLQQRLQVVVLFLVLLGGTVDQLGQRPRRPAHLLDLQGRAAARGAEL